ncbi:hypothetical protein KUCAC02_023550, partial [Chaenocephalus aceratus]
SPTGCSLASLFCSLSLFIPLILHPSLTPHRSVSFPLSPSSLCSHISPLPLVFGLPVDLRPLHPPRPSSQ